MLKWYITTCEKSRHIVPAQKHLFKKYAPNAELVYIDLGSEPVQTWGHNVLKRLPDDEFCVFGLDDYLPIGPLDENFFELASILVRREYERFELGWGASKKIGFIRVVSEGTKNLIYGTDTPYSVSCQFSIWRMSALKRILKKCTTPWNFETKHKCKAACFEHPVFRWIEESALSGRHPGKINVLGLRPADLKELIDLNLIDGSKIQYGMPRGPVPEFDPKNVGPKYQEFYG